MEVAASTLRSRRWRRNRSDSSCSAPQSFAQLSYVFTIASNPWPSHDHIPAGVTGVVASLLFLMSVPPQCIRAVDASPVCAARKVVASVDVEPAQEPYLPRARDPLQCRLRRELAGPPAAIDFACQNEH